MMHYILYFLIPFLIAILATPLFKRFALQHHVVARQNHRTVHRGEIPKLGGGAIFLAFLIGLVVLAVTKPEMILTNVKMLASLAAGATVLFFLGAIDDKADLNCNFKLAIEILAASVAVATGWRIEALLLPAQQELTLGFLSYPISVLWIVGVANSFNMIDGLDGLAGGVATAILLSAMAISALFGNTLVPIICIILAGAVLGFLRYNISPASIFMGDSGSLSLGFLLACLTLNAAIFDVNKAALLIPLLLLGLPLTDTLLAIFRRWRKGIHPFHADREHVHHRLVALGLSQSGAALALVGLTFILGVMAYLVAHGIQMDLKILN
ncbi:undecaprenyl/decaprenyl-phosphate alpha-N-acetylglucosaminyl 1-phosphate transferase [candidate division KSB1 bacterium]|nr:undecaprenyl/decaprenyl-phosphate alpha-N-acetylglucosaminyl 1-phosphate transferase [candidate division KSB1 bacterium]RQW07175.1 MAG: undecaprenyl/decaprenyl-phosphate alpha-N-acetylglucosaminyl 1-phosphate transferase [candidate division KSB1 bacterium]